MRPRPSDPFFALVQKARNSSGEIDLARGALLIALQAYPDLDIEHYLRQLDALSEDFRTRYAAADSLSASLANLSQYVFDDLGFRGNSAHYDDPRNSYLNEVLDRRLGIPITLAVVYLELGKRLSFPLAGVNFPHHFLVRSTQGDEPLFVDPFANGAFVDGKSLGERLPVIEGRRLELAPEFIEPTSSLHILARMLRNLKRLHFQAREFSTAIRWAEKIAYLQPDEAENYRDLGFLYHHTREYLKAIEAFSEYLRQAGDAPDVPTIEHNIRVLANRLIPLN